TARYKALPSTARATPGWLSDTARCCCRPRIDWPARNVTSAVGRVTATVAITCSAAFPHRIGSRRGTAAKLAKAIGPLSLSRLACERGEGALLRCGVARFGSVRPHGQVARRV